MERRKLSFENTDSGRSIVRGIWNLLVLGIAMTAQGQSEQKRDVAKTRLDGKLIRAFKAITVEDAEDRTSTNEPHRKLRADLEFPATVELDIDMWERLNENARAGIVRLPAGGTLEGVEALDAIVGAATIA